MSLDFHLNRTGANRNNAGSALRQKGRKGCSGTPSADCSLLRTQKGRTLLQRLLSVAALTGESDLPHGNLDAVNLMRTPAQIGRFRDAGSNKGSDFI